MLGQKRSWASDRVSARWACMRLIHGPTNLGKASFDFHEFLLMTLHGLNPSSNTLNI
jgi:hypothetical protein